MRLVVISDTHNRHKKIELPYGDVLIHCGDATAQGRSSEIREFSKWFHAQPHPHKLFVAGNHDMGFQDHPVDAVVELSPGLDGVNYLMDSGVEIDGVKFWGSPWTKMFNKWAFMKEDNDPELVKIYDRIPTDTDVLITHGPPIFILDKANRSWGDDGGHCGLTPLSDAVRRIRPQIHVFGHVHEAYGQEESGGTKFGNAAICDLSYVPVHAPLVYDVSPRSVVGGTVAS